MKSIIIAITTDHPASFQKSLDHNFTRTGCATDLLIIDNGSGDSETKNLVKEFVESFDARIREVPFHTGLGNAMNIGLKLAFDAGYEYIQFCGHNILEADCWLTDKILCAASTPNPGMIAAKCGDHKDSVAGDLSAIPGTISAGQPLVTRKLVGTIGYFNAFGGLNGPVLEDYSLRASASGFNCLLLQQRFFSYSAPTDPVTAADLDHAHHQLVTMGEHRENIRQYKNARNLYRPFQIDDRRSNPGSTFSTLSAAHH